MPDGDSIFGVTVRSGRRSGGRVAVAGLYYLAALDAGSELITSNGWQDPATLEGLRRSATRVTVLEGEARFVTLPMTSDR